MTKGSVYCNGASHNYFRVFNFSKARAAVIELLRKDTKMPWKISVKTVGANPSNFTISVEPEDLISSIHQKIEDVTGLHSQQQRLIYRGRMISGKEGKGTMMLTDCDEPVQLRICDVDGLNNGHTIHLVPRPTEASNVTQHEMPERTINAATDSQSDQQTTEISDSESGNASFGGSPAGGLLAALLGMGLSSPNIRRNDDGDDDYDIEAFLSSIPVGNRPIRSARRRPNSHRRTAMDERYPNPCPLEPVRQGLMTLHTMMECGSNNMSAAAPFLAKRKFYKGQWLDLRDTVNQWLEATVVEVIVPDDILVRKSGITAGTSTKVNGECNFSSSTSTASAPKRVKRPAMDPAVGANDHKGRLRLLLEESEEESDRTLSELNNNDDLIGWKERDNNANVQILLVHYNGWPHRWDEWIRSDSERIRPFRTRSKHEPSRGFLSPSPDATFHSAPTTFVASDDDNIDRVAILPELYRCVADVQNIFSGAINADDCPISSEEGCEKMLTDKEQSDLSDAIKALRPEKFEEVMKILQGKHEGGKDMDPSDIDVRELDNIIQWKLKNLLQPLGDPRRDDQLPWLLRHSDYLDDSSCGYSYEGLESTRSTLTGHSNIDKNKLEALAPLLDRLGRIMIDAAPHIASIADSLPESNLDQEGIVPSDEALSSDTTAPGLPRRLLRPTWSGIYSSEPDNPEIDSDYVDFIHGFINHRHSHASAPRRSRRDQSDSNLGTTLLSAYLASAMNDRNFDGGEDAQNGPRVVRIGPGATAGGGGGGTTGNGVGIHIHAVVTGPGGIPMSGLPGGGAPDSSRNTRINSNTDEARSQNNHQSVLNNEVTRTNSGGDEENGLFDDLYSEEPSHTEAPPIAGENNEDEIVDDGGENNESVVHRIDHHLGDHSIDGNVNNSDSLPSLHEPNDESSENSSDERLLQIDTGDDSDSNNIQQVEPEVEVRSSIHELGEAATNGQEERGRRAPFFARIFRRTSQRRISDN